MSLRRMVESLLLAALGGALAGCSLTVNDFAVGSRDAGPDGNGECDPNAGDGGAPAAMGRLREIYSMGHFTCGLSIDGEAYCWGRGDQGQLGTGTCADRPWAQRVIRPRNVPVENATEISVGFDHACVVLDGNIHCWGDGAGGRLGCGSDEMDQTVAVPCSSGLDEGRAVFDVAAGYSHSCAVIAGGEVFCTGDPATIPDAVGHDGLIGSWRIVEWTTMMGGRTDVVLAGRELSCALTLERMACWTSTDTLVTASRNGVEVAGVPAMPFQADIGVSEGTASETDACMLSGDAASAALHCWGSNIHGVASPANAGSAFGAPNPVPGAPANPVDVDVGGGHACAVAEGAVYCWGRSDVGQAGPSAQVETIALPGGLTFVSVAAGVSHSCALANSGEVFCWGDNTYGQLGNGSIGGSSATPTPVMGVPQP